MIDRWKARKVANYFYKMDRHCRRDLYLGLIVSERDYISRLMTHLMYPFGPVYPNPFLFCSTTTSFAEQLFGCDGLLVFKAGNQAKIGMFESKRIGNSDWDKKRVSRGLSRFSSQIEDQSRWARIFAIWEMFLISNPSSSEQPFDRYGSSCVWHDLAYDAIIRTGHNRLPGLAIRGTRHRQLWNDEDVEQLLTERWNTNPKDISIKWMIYRMLICQKGTIHSIHNRIIPIQAPTSDTLTIDSYPNHIPLLDTNSDSTEIQTFMKESGLQYYLSIDLDLWI